MSWEDDQHRVDVDPLEAGNLGAVDVQADVAVVFARCRGGTEDQRKLTLFDNI